MMKITIPNVLIVHLSKDTSAGDLECQEFKIFPHGFTTRMSLNILRVSETFGNKMTHRSTQWLNNDKWRMLATLADQEPIKFEAWSKENP